MNKIYLLSNTAIRRALPVQSFCQERKMIEEAERFLPCIVKLFHADVLSRTMVVHIFYASLQSAVLYLQFHGTSTHKKRSQKRSLFSFVGLNCISHGFATISKFLESIPSHPSDNHQNKNLVNKISDFNTWISIKKVFENKTVFVLLMIITFKTNCSFWQVSNDPKSMNQVMSSP